MDRRKALEDLKNHPWLGRLWKRLSVAEATEMECFVNLNYMLDNGDWERAVNRLWLDRPERRPKRWKEIQELLLSTSQVVNKRRS